MDIGNQVVRVDIQIDMKMVAAQRVISLLVAIGVLQNTEVPWITIVIEDHLLIQLT
jgi:hypothetical protein